MSIHLTGRSAVTVACARALAACGGGGGAKKESMRRDTRLSLRTETVGMARTSIGYTSKLGSSQFGVGEVAITTPQPLVITGSDSYPGSGQLLVRGNANSAVRITALNDAQGDGTYETQTVKTWAELE
ncbi:MAG: hypothetical protein ACT6S0_09390 [Roseateles sp.]|uniref:hypothetical protein n=1 Tax=Roseateles sp. TaxID=1971397 RepID=UPI004036B23C